jgi:hypothetical protein
MRDCECKKTDLEVACVMEGCWCVLCHGCGALTYHGDTKEAAKKLWEENSLQRSWGYNWNPQRKIDMINLGRQISGMEPEPDTGVAEVRDERDGLG